MLRSFRALHTLLSENQRGQVQRLLQNTLRGGGGQAILKLLGEIENAVNQYKTTAEQVVAQRNTTVANLTKKGEEKDVQLASKNEELARKNEELDRKEGELKQLNETNAELNTQLTKTQADLERTKATLQTRMQEIKHLKDLQTSSTENQNGLQQQLTKATERNHLLKTQIDKAMATLEQTKIKLVEIEKKTNSTLKTKISKNLHGLSTQLGTLKTNIEKLQTSASEVPAKQDGYAKKLQSILNSINTNTLGSS